MPKTDSTTYQCSECKMTFQGKRREFKAHLKQHEANAEVSYECNQCGKSFSKKFQLKDHILIHTQPLRCTECPRTFARSYQLDQHLKSHRGEKPFRCKLCDVAFSSSGNLKVHLKRHLGLKEFSCEVCGKAFTRRDGLQKHLSCFHGGEKPFECNICGKRYKGHLMQHLRTHLQEKPHKCDDCDMCFVQRSQLVVHQRIHTGEKPYPCTECGRRFAHSTALKLHMRRHTGEKPFICPLCPSTAFVQLPHLKKHMRCIHKTDNPYMCLRCRNFFKKKAELDAHVELCKINETLPPGKCNMSTQTEEEFELALEAPDSDGSCPPDVTWKASSDKEMSPANEAECQTESEVKPTKSKSEAKTSPAKRKPTAKAPAKGKKPVKGGVNKGGGKKLVEAKASTRSLRSKPKEDEEEKEEADSKIVFSVQSEPMSADRLRFLIGELFKKISEPKRLQALGFGKRSVDDVLEESIAKSGRTPCTESIPEIDKLRKNLEILLEWTIPKEHLTQLRNEGCTTENILEGLAS
ncbi:Hypothetical predicted protein [Cloeon dipterum]|uniref:C2H2-type domain-containing protein n=1 Tax=Cloeon dipterum TaxID=197152 RepID=A0A8S1DM33_9INSE|nr:Hypothetical predicted protein [Cloeon dipterum]